MYPAQRCNARVVVAPLSGLTPPPYISRAIFTRTRGHSGQGVLCGHRRLHLGNLARAGKAILVQDLLRSRVGYLMAAATVRIVTRSRVVRVDAVRSVRAAFSLDEAAGLVREAGLSGARIEPCWPQRFALSWEAK